MTNAEKIQIKGEILTKHFATLRHTALHNGAALRASAGAEETAEHIAECDTGRVAALVQDLCTIDRVRGILRDFGSTIPLHLYRPEGKTTAELASLANNDPSLAVAQYDVITGGESGTEFDPPRCDWAVLRITHDGTEILSCGGGYYQAYTATTNSAATGETAEEDSSAAETTTVSTTFVQQGDTDLLRAVLDAEPAAWTAQTFAADLRGLATYSESGIDYYVVPCDLPGALDQLMSLCIYRSAEGETAPANLAYTLNAKSCSTATDGMIGLPHGIWLIYDNSALASAPMGLLVPRELADGDTTGIRWERVEIKYNALLSGMERLRLVSDAWEEVIVSTQDDDVFEPAWALGAEAQESGDLTLRDALNLRTAYIKAKANMAAAGMDVSGVRYIRDLPPILENHLPEELSDMAEELASDPDVAELRSALEDLASGGVLYDAIYEPTDKAREEDVNA